MLSARLAAILNKINGCETLLDVGCDHGYLVCEAVRSGRARRGIASDIRKDPLSAAKKNIKKAGLSEKIDSRLGGGLSTVAPGEADIVVIAGMGGMMIGEILRENEEIARGIKGFILQPMNCIPELRRFLCESGYRIENETLAAEQKKIYTVMSVTNGEFKPYPKEIMYYTGNVADFTDTPEELVDKYLTGFENKFSKIITGIERSSSKEGLSDYLKLTEELLWLRSETLRS